jgi:EipB-like
MRKFLAPIAASTIVLASSAAIATPRVAGSAEAGEASVRLQPHRAIYDITLDETKAGTSIGSITGRVVYELMGNPCEGYAQNMRFVTETTTTEGQSSMSDLRTSSWEDAPARRLRFSSSTYGNDELIEQTQGTATKRNGSTPALAVEVTKPSRKSTRIGEHVFFPIDHSATIIRHARTGKRLFAANLYDGSEGGEKYYFTTSFIGPPSTETASRRMAKLENGDKLAGVTSWPVSIAYYKPEARHIDSVPLYEMSFRFHENGITSELMIDHGEYRLKGELKELKLIEANPCP